MRDNLINALETITTEGWANRSWGSLHDGTRFVSLIDATTERDMISEVLAGLDYVGMPTLEDVPSSWYVLVEYDDGTADAYSAPTKQAALAIFDAECHD